MQSLMFYLIGLSNFVTLDTSSHVTMYIKKSFYRGKFLVWGSNNRKNYFNHHMHPYVFLSISKILSAHNTLQKLLLKVFRNILTLFYLMLFGRLVFVDIQTNSLKDVFLFF